VCLVGANRTIYTVTENACIFFGFAKSRAFGGAPRSAIINCRLCLTSNPLPILRKAKRSFPLAAPPSTLVKSQFIFQKEKRTTLGAFLFLEQVTRVELAGNSLGILLSSIFFGYFGHFIYFLCKTPPFLTFLCKFYSKYPP